MEHLDPIFSAVVQRQIKEELVEELEVFAHHTTIPHKTEVENKASYVVDLQQKKVYYGDHNMASKVIIKQENFGEEENIDEDFNHYDNIDFSIVKQEKEIFLEEPNVDHGLRFKQGNRESLFKPTILNGVVNVKNTCSPENELKDLVSNSTRVCITGPARKKDKFHKCLECHYKTVRPDHLIRHQRAIHLKHKPFKCSQCTFKCSEARSLKRHVISKHPLEKPYKCPKCQFKAISEQEMNRHLESQHKKNNLNCCLECGYKTEKFQDLEKHVADVHIKAKDDSNKCFDCSYIAQSAQELKNHIAYLHKVHQCSLCDYKTTDLRDINKHIRSVHAGDKPYICSQCGFRAPDASKLKRHKVTKHPLEKPYHCPDCDFKTASERDMKRHTETQHPHKCEKCDFKTGQYQDLEKHIAKFHMDDESNSSDDSESGSHSTDEVVKHFTSNNPKAKLRDHKKTISRDGAVSGLRMTDHLKDNSFQCSLCRFSSLEAAILKRHKVTKHPLEKPYHCPDCDFKTASERDMKRHTETQHPHKCEKCDFKTGQYQDLEKHIAKFHMDDESNSSDDSESVSHSTDEVVKHFTSNNPKAKLRDHKKTISRDGAVSRLRMTDHLKDNSFQCSLCRFSSLEAATLKRHMGAKHPKEKASNCPDSHFKADKERPIERCNSSVNAKKNECFVSDSSIEQIKESKKHSVPKKKVSESETDRLIDDQKHYECIHCDFKTTNPIHLNRHIKAIHAKEMPYQCSQCGFSAAEAIVLKRHVMSKHPKLTSYQCPDCSYETTNVLEMNKHTTTLHPNDLEEHTNICCTESGGSKGDVTDSNNDSEPCIKNEIKKAKTYQCEHCEYNTKNAQHLVRHDRAIHKKEKPFKCLECEFSAVEAIYLKRHMMSKHPFEKPYHCSDCDFKTSNERSLKRHSENQHPPDITPKCKKCKYKSSSKSDLKNHLVAFHSDKEPHKCQDCEFTTSSSLEFRRHVKTSHSKEKHSCSQCEYTSLNRDDLDKHALSIHKNCLNKNIKVKNTKKKIYNIKKPVCKLRYSSDVQKEALPINLRGKKSSNSLKSKAKSFECGHCDYKTEFSRNLRRHVMAIHKKDKPFLCPMCSFTCAELGCLKNHVLAKHL